MTLDFDSLLKRLAKPAQRAILGTGVNTLEELSQFTEEEVRRLQGIGKSAVSVIESTLKEHGVSFSSKR